MVERHNQCGEGRSGLKEQEGESKRMIEGQKGVRAFDPWCVGEVFYGVRKGSLGEQRGGANVSKA